MTGSDAERGLAEEAFRAELGSLIEEAHERGLDIHQNWTWRSNGGVPDCEVEFVRLQEQSD